MSGVIMDDRISACPQKGNAIFRRGTKGDEGCLCLAYQGSKLRDTAEAGEKLPSLTLSFKPPNATFLKHTLSPVYSHGAAFGEAETAHSEIQFRCPNWNFSRGP